MNISNLFNFSTLGNRSQARAASAAALEASPLAQAVLRADQRLAGEVSDNMAQLSAFGQLQSSLSQAQLAGRELADMPQGAAHGRLATALGKLVETLNGAMSRAVTTASVAGPSEAGQSAQRVVRDLQGVLQQGPLTPETLNNIGVRWESGKFGADVAQLESALGADAAGTKRLLTQLAQAVDATTGAELGAHGNVNGPLDLLKRHANTLQAQQSALQSAALATSAYTSGSTGSSRQGVAAYLSNIG